MKYLFTILCLWGSFASAQYVKGYQGQLNPNYVATIPTSTTTSTLITLGGFTPVGIYFPAVMTGSTVSFTASPTAGGTFVPVKDATGTLTMVATGSLTYVALDPKTFEGINFLKIVSASTEAAARTLILSLKGF